MKNFSPNCFFVVAGVASSLWMPAFNVAAQTTVTTAPVGYLQTSCLSNSDTLVAPPFTRPAAFTGAVGSISSNVVTLSSTTLTADAYDAPTTTPLTKDTYYLTIGPATATLTGTVSVTSGSTTVTGTSTTFGTDVKVGDRITINDGVNLLTYTVTAIASTTSLTIDRAFSDTAATGGTSSIASASKPTATKATPTKATATKAANGTATAAVPTNSATLSTLAATYDHSPYEGRFYQVTTNGTNSVTVNLNGDVLSSVAAGTQVSIIPYWTLNSMFPAANAGVSFTATTNPHQVQTEVLIPNFSGTGTNLSSSATYLFYSGGSTAGWRSYSDLSTDQGYVPLLPDGYFTVTTPATAPSLPVTFAGSVPINKQVTAISTNATQLQDNAVALTRPADATLGTLGLNPTDGSFVATTNGHNLQDQLLVYNNTVAAPYKSSSGTYIYVNIGTNIGWRSYSDLNTDQSSFVIPAGSALTIRKAPTSSGQTVAWTNSPNY